ncbi:siderophore-interacting protein [Actinoplanes sp. NPDC051851]|uniref:siderophore-interacting protein n=1 Tax=Actinoplanes sp. NPDC051851 TaxID=3154753 RepID=UPI003419691D
MPTMPAAIAARAERWFGHPATVTEVTVLSPGLRTVTMAGDALRGRRYRPGDEIEFLVSEREFRHYTPSAYDPGTGTCSVVFQTHAGGPGSAWAAALKPGDPVSVMGPGGGVRFDPTVPAVLLGDATALGLFAALEASGTQVSGAIEIPAEDTAAAATVVRSVEVVAASTLRSWVTAHGAEVAAAKSRVYAVGHAQTIQQLRTLLRESGVSRQSIVVKAYWATGRTGL